MFSDFMRRSLSVSAAGDPNLPPSTDKPMNYPQFDPGKFNSRGSLAMTESRLYLSVNQGPVAQLVSDRPAEVAGSSPVRVAKVLVSYFFKADIRTLFGLVAQLVRAND